MNTMKYKAIPRIFFIALAGSRKALSKLLNRTLCIGENGACKICNVKMCERKKNKLDQIDGHKIDFLLGVLLIINKQFSVTSLYEVNFINKYQLCVSWSPNSPLKASKYTRFVGTIKWNHIYTFIRNIGLKIFIWTA